MALPEKDFYTLDEVARRWECIGFGASSFLDLATKDLLVFSIYRREIGSHRTVVETPDAVITKRRDVLFSFKAEGYSSDGVRYLRADDARRILEAKLGEEILVPGLGLSDFLCVRLRSLPAGCFFPDRQPLHLTQSAG